MQLMGSAGLGGQDGETTTTLGRKWTQPAGAAGQHQ